MSYRRTTSEALMPNLFLWVMENGKRESNLYEGGITRRSGGSCSWEREMKRAETFCAASHGGQKMLPQAHGIPRTTTSFQTTGHNKQLVSCFCPANAAIFHKCYYFLVESRTGWQVRVPRVRVPLKINCFPCLQLQLGFSSALDTAAESQHRHAYAERLKPTIAWTWNCGDALQRP